MLGRFLSVILLPACFAFPQVSPGQTFRAGAATSNITPRMGVPLDGTIMQIGPAKDVHDELFARCLALDDGFTRLALVVVDNTMVSREVLDEAKSQIEAHTGIPPSHVCISATHTHSSPRAVVGLVDDELHRDYLEFLASRIADGVRRAVNRLEPARIAWGSFEEPRFVHNRRWVVSDALRSKNTNPFGINGEAAKMNPGRNGLERPTGPVDPEVFVLSIKTAAGRPLAVLSAYGLHYIGGIPGGVVSADYFGVYADRLAKDLTGERDASAFVGMMANGTSGDVNANNLAGPPEKSAPYEKMNLVGNALAEGTLELIKGLDHRHEAIRLAAAASVLELGVRKPDAKRLEWALQTSAGVQPGQRLTQGQIYARETNHLAGYPDTISMPLQVFRIGSLAVVQIPCETFASTGLAIKADSPFAGSTFTIELANGFFGYLPPPEQFDLGGYETWPARSSFLEEQAEVKIRQRVGELLDSLKPAK